MVVWLLDRFLRDHWHIERRVRLLSTRDFKWCNRSAGDLGHSTHTVKLLSFLLLFLLLRWGKWIATLGLSAFFQGFHDCSRLIDAVLSSLRPFVVHRSFEKVEQFNEILSSLEIDGVFTCDCLTSTLFFISLSKDAEYKVFNMELKIVLFDVSHSGFHAFKLTKFLHEVGLSLIGTLSRVVVTES